MINEKQIKRILISRTDNLGDVVLTLPLCIWLKSQFPEATLVYLCKSYTAPVVSCFVPVDEMLLIESLESLNKEGRNKALKADVILHVFPNQKIAQWAKEAKIPYRIGTSHRWFHWLFCNHRVDFTRKGSSLNESQLNFHLVQPLGLSEIPSFDSIRDTATFFQAQAKPMTLDNYFIIHPFSKGSAVEYPLKNYVTLAEHLVEKGFQVMITGTASEAAKIGTSFDHIDGVTNACAKFNLSELIAIIKHSKGFVACSTGPLHLAGVMNVKTIGLFSPRKPIDPGRWSPLGTSTQSLVFDDQCEQCANNKTCNCIARIPVETLLIALLN